MPPLCNERLFGLPGYFNILVVLHVVELAEGIGSVGPDGVPTVIWFLY